MDSSDEIKILKKVRSLVYGRYNWSGIAIAIQMFGASLIATVLQLVALMLIFVTSMGNGSSDFIGMTASLNEYNMFISGIAYITCNLTAAFLCMKLSKTGSLKQMFRKPEKSFGALDILLSVLAILGLSTLDSLFMNGLSFIFGSSDEALGAIMTGGVFSDKLWVQVGTLAYIAVLGPITEEILVRGACLPMCSHISTRFGIVASALLFGIMHGNITQFFNAFVLGLALAYVTVKSRSIIPAMLMHVANNSLAVVQMFMTNYMSEEKYQIVDNITTAVLVVLGISSLVFLVIRKGKVDDRDDAIKVNIPAPAEYIEMAKTPSNNLTAKTFFSSWAFWVVTGYAVFNSIIVIIFGNALMQG
ncbi:MAG: CPBP family intramembrane metalloprotease [Clostridiales bacterium]|nr:CPBP family intramembrane metalloprotease [Clostridiales bacterium]